MRQIKSAGKYYLMRELRQSGPCTVNYATGQTESRQLHTRKNRKIGWWA